MHKPPLPLRVGCTDQGCAGRSIFLRGKGKNLRGGATVKIRRAKNHVNPLIQKFDKSAYIVTGGFVIQYGALINENITFPDF